MQSQQVSLFAKARNSISNYIAAEPRPPGGKELTTERGVDVGIEDLIQGGQLVGEMDNFDTRVAKDGLSIYDDMMTDAQIRMAINAKRYAVISADWDVLPADSDDKLQVEAADFCAMSLRRMPGSVVSMVFEAMGALVHGYSIAEINLEAIAAGQYAGKWTLASVRAKDPADYEFDFTPYGEVSEIWLTHGYGNKERVPLWKFPIYTYQPQYGRVFGQSDMRAIYKNWWAKQRLQKFLLIHAEDFGNPTRIGKYPAGQDSKSTAFRNAIKKLGNRKVITVPSDFDVEFLDGGGRGGEIIKKAIDYQDEQITKGILGETLTSGVDTIGSMALGNVHQETKEDCVTYLRKDVAETFITEKIISVLMRFNYGAVTELPRFAFQPRKGKLVLANMADLKSLVETGALTNRDMNILRDRLDLPFRAELDNDDPFEMPEKPAGGMFAAPVINVTPPAPDGKSDYAAPTARALNESSMHACEKRLGGVSYYRREIAKQEAAESDLVDGFAPILKRMLPEVQKSVKNRVLTSPGVADRRELNKLKLPPGLVAELNRTAITWITGLTASEYATALKEVDVDKRGIPDKSEYASKLDISLEAGVPVDAVTRMNTWTETGQWDKVRAWRANRLLTLGGTHASMAQFWITDVVETELLKDVKNTIIAGVTNGQSETAVMAGIRKSFEKWGADPALTDPTRLTVIARTNTTRALAESRRLAYQDPTTQESFPASMYSAIMDDRTSETCANLDTRVYRNDDPIWNSITPPMHYNCRSTLIPVTVEEYTERGQSRKPNLADVPAEFGGEKI